MIPSSESLELGRQLCRRNVTSFQLHRTKERSNTVASQLQQGSRKGSNACSILALTTATGCWIQTDFPFPSYLAGLGIRRFCSHGGDGHGEGWCGRALPCPRGRVLQSEDSNRGLRRARSIRLGLTCPRRRYCQSLPFNPTMKRKNPSQLSCTTSGSSLTRPAH